MLETFYGSIYALVNVLISPLIHDDNGINVKMQYTQYHNMY